MKLCLFTLSIFMSFSLFAGDTYLTCLDEDNREVVNAYVGETSVISGTYYLMPDYLFDYQFNTETFVLRASIIDVHGSGSIDSKTEKLEYYKEVNFKKGVTCFLAD